MEDQQEGLFSYIRRLRDEAGAREARKAAAEKAEKERREALIWSIFYDLMKAIPEEARCMFDGNRRVALVMGGGNIRATFTAKINGKVYSWFGVSATSGREQKLSVMYGECFLPITQFNRYLLETIETIEAREGPFI